MSVGNKDGGDSKNKRQVPVHKPNPPGSNKGHKDSGTKPDKSEGQKDGKGFS